MRSGVWDHTTFREQPLLRLQRTGYAAMMMVFGARSRTRAMVASDQRRPCPRRRPHFDGRGVPGRRRRIAHVGARHGHVRLPAGLRHVRASGRDRGGRPRSMPRTSRRRACTACRPRRLRDATPEALFERMASAARTVRRSCWSSSPSWGPVPLLPGPLRAIQRLLLAAAVQTLPADLRDRLGLAGRAWRLARWQWALGAGARARPPTTWGACHPAGAQLAVRRLTSTAA